MLFEVYWLSVPSNAGKGAKERVNKGLATRSIFNFIGFYEDCLYSRSPKQPNFALNLLRFRAIAATATSLIKFNL